MDTPNATEIPLEVADETDDDRPEPEPQPDVLLEDPESETPAGKEPE